MADVQHYLALNRDLWDKRVRAHLQHGLYPSEEVEAGSYAVGLPDAEEVGDVAGKRLLHLQCNAGADTLYWARQGARVTGLDFSEEAIAEARRLSEVTGVSAEFVCADVYAAAEVCAGPFDVIYTSMGVLWWLPDLPRWAEIIAALLVPGGFFYIHEIHPVAMALRAQDNRLVVEHDYFGAPEPIVERTDGTYYETPPGFSAEPATECGWVHPLAEVVSSLAGAGLRVVFLHEHEATAFRMLPILQHGTDGRWRSPEGVPRVPLTFSLKAVR